MRAVGYAELPVDEAKARLKPLREQFGLDVMKAAADEILHIDMGRHPPVVRLTDVARKLAWQLLGPPPERVEEFESQAPWPLPPCA